ncbi:class I SAM-dependent methyltransferase [Oxalobacter sp. OttesenSCG-928-P03]|nr:class I SAM-dependent methyltransferase [Oxalobacter sp. OttesenSCG-928-P03]
MKNKLDSHITAYQRKNIYDFDIEILLDWYPKRVIENSKFASSFLELGLGHGFTTNIFSENYTRHIVIEGSPAIIGNFKERFPSCNTQIIESFFEDFQTAEKFDVIMMGFILEHVDDPLKIIKRFKKFLSSSGKIFITVPNAEVLNRRIGVAAGLLNNIEELSENDILVGHKRYYTVESLTDLIVKSGLKIKKTEGIYLKPLTTSQMISLSLDHKIINALCEIGVNYPELSCGIFVEASL